MASEKGSSAVNWEALGILTCERCHLKTSDKTLLQFHNCRISKRKVSSSSHVSRTAPCTEAVVANTASSSNTVPLAVSREKPGSSAGVTSVTLPRVTAVVQYNRAKGVTPGGSLIVASPKPSLCSITSMTTTSSATIPRLSTAQPSNPTSIAQSGSIFRPHQMKPNANQQMAGAQLRFPRVLAPVPSAGMKSDTHRVCRSVSLNDGSLSQAPDLRRSLSAREGNVSTSLSTLSRSADCPVTSRKVSMKLVNSATESSVAACDNTYGYDQIMKEGQGAKVSQSNKVDMKSTLRALRGVFLCMTCKIKWADHQVLLFIKHVWEHIHPGTCQCSNEFPEKNPCASLKEALRVIFSNSLEKMPDEVKQYISRVTADSDKEDTPVAKKEVEPLQTAVTTDIPEPSNENLCPSNHSVPKASESSLPEKQVENNVCSASPIYSSSALPHGSKKTIPCHVNNSQAQSNESSLQKASLGNALIDDTRPADEFLLERNKEPACVSSENERLIPQLSSEQTSNSLTNVSSKAANRRCNSDAEKSQSVESESELSCFYKCGFSQCTFSSYKPMELLLHTSQAHGLESEFPCVYCGYIGSRDSVLLSHMQEHICDEEKSKFMYSCSLVFDSGDVKDLRHQRLDVLFSMVNSYMMGESSMNTSFKLLCKYCDQTFDEIGDLKQHYDDSLLLTVVECRHCMGYFLDSASCKRHISREHPNSRVFYRFSKKLLCKKNEVMGAAFEKFKKAYKDKFVSRRQSTGTDLSDNIAVCRNICSPDPMSKAPQGALNRTPVCSDVSDTNLVQQKNCEAFNYTDGQAEKIPKENGVCNSTPPLVDLELLGVIRNECVEDGDGEVSSVAIQSTSDLNQGNRMGETGDTGHDKGTTNSAEVSTVRRCPAQDLISSNLEPSKNTSSEVCGQKTSLKPSWELHSECVDVMEVPNGENEQAVKIQSSKKVQNEIDVSAESSDVPIEKRDSTVSSVSPLNIALQGNDDQGEKDPNCPRKKQSPNTDIQGEKGDDQKRGGKSSDAYCQKQKEDSKKEKQRSIVSECVDHGENDQLLKGFKGQRGDHNKTEKPSDSCSREEKDQNHSTEEPNVSLIDGVVHNNSCRAEKQKFSDTVCEVDKDRDNRTEKTKSSNAGSEGKKDQDYRTVKQSSHGRTEEKDHEDGNELECSSSGNDQGGKPCRLVEKQQTSDKEKSISVSPQDFFCAPSRSKDKSEHHGKDLEKLRCSVPGSDIKSVQESETVTEEKEGELENVVHCDTQFVTDSVTSDNSSSPSARDRLNSAENEKSVASGKVMNSSLSQRTSASDNLFERIGSDILAAFSNSVHRPSSKLPEKTKQLVLNTEVVETLEQPDVPVPHDKDKRQGEVQLLRLYDTCGTEALDCLDSLYATDRNGKYTCKKCTKRFKGLKIIHCHVLWCVGGIAIALCPHCLYKDAHPKLITNHIKKMHPGEDAEEKLFHQVDWPYLSNTLQSQKLNIDNFRNICKPFTAVNVHAEKAQEEHVEMLCSESQESDEKRGQAQVCVEKECAGDKTDQATEKLCLEVIAEKSTSHSCLSEKRKASDHLHPLSSSSASKQNKVCANTEPSIPVVSECQVEETSLSSQVLNENYDSNEKQVNSMHTSVDNVPQNSHQDIQSSTGLIESHSSSKSTVLFMCTHCTYKSYSYTVAQRHARHDHEGTLAKVKKVSTQEQNIEESRERYKCRLCPVEYEKWDDNAMQKHIDEKHKFFECSYCKFPYFILSHLYNHMKFAHQDDGSKVDKLSPSSVFVDVCDAKSKPILTLETEGLLVQKGQKRNMNQNETDAVGIKTVKRRCLKKYVGLKKGKFPSKELTFMGNKLPSESENEICIDLTTDKDDIEASSKSEKQMTEVPVSEIVCNICHAHFKCFKTLKTHMGLLHRTLPFQGIGRQLNPVLSKSSADTPMTNELPAGTASDDKDQSESPSTQNGKSFNKTEEFLLNNELAESDACANMPVSSLTDQTESDTVTVSQDTTHVPAHSPPTRYSCHLCDAILSTEFFFRLHLAKHGGFSKLSVLTSTDGLLLCSKCGYIAVSMNDLAQHTASHMDERRYFCSLCGADAHQKAGVTCHIKKMHREEDNAMVKDRKKQKESVDLKPKLVCFDPMVCIVDPFKQTPEDLRNLLSRNGITLLDSVVDEHSNILDFVKDDELFEVTIKPF
ncbi:uncharacterized protein LOC101855529 isoform X2 [Aplysia californica]|uniref:Uncharacterized protein LOC101855529 isoform X2 n=1 Tax=Aplysia californica TaxID=6500 RepID=A0ABM0K6J9_APLCA|nr:uncharacterized protein LOC101855529 isoform X2 [Aplysia californica]